MTHEGMAILMNYYLYRIAMGIGVAVIQHFITYGKCMNNVSKTCLIVWRILFEFALGVCSINDNGYRSSLLEYKLNRF